MMIILIVAVVVVVKLQNRNCPNDKIKIEINFTLN